MTGRGALAVVQTHEWCFTLFCGAAEVVLKGPKSRTNEWQHVVGTYDGTMMRLFINGRPTARLEVAPEVLAQNEDANAGRKEELDQIQKDEDAARALCKKQTDKQAKMYMQTSEGTAAASKTRSKSRNEKRIPRRHAAHQAGSHQISRTKRI